MANVKLHLYISGVLSKTYVIEGFLLRNEKKNQTSVPIPVPLGDDTTTIINSIFGQRRFFNCGFIVMDRTDDYTDGTGSPVTKDQAEQRDFILDEIFKPEGYHILEDQNGVQFTGRIEEMNFVEAGDDPQKLDVTFSFQRGAV